MIIIIITSLRRQVSLSDSLVLSLSLWSSPKSATSHGRMRPANLHVSATGASFSLDYNNHHDHTCNHAKSLDMRGGEPNRLPLVQCSQFAGELWAQRTGRGARWRARSIVLKFGATLQRIAFCGGASHSPVFPVMAFGAALA